MPPLSGQYRELRASAQQELEAVVSSPSARGAAAGLTLKTSLSTYVDLSSRRRAAFMDPKVKLKSYGTAHTHSSPEAIKIIREATETIETTLEELSTDFPARRDAAANAESSRACTAEKLRIIPYVSLGPL